MAEPAVVLVSGGMDSAVVLALARAEGLQCAALSFDYGQRHRSELAAAQRVSASLGVTTHRIIQIDLRAFGASALTDPLLTVPKDQAQSGHQAGDVIPITYVPARNTVFLSLALAYAESRGIRDIFIGANAVDYSGYPDCRPEFMHAFETLANLGTRAGVEFAARGQRWFRIRTPIIEWSKARIVREGIRLGVDFGLTLSCYDPVELDSVALACGRCDACRLRRRGFEEAEARDPTRYVPNSTT